MKKRRYPLIVGVSCDRNLSDGRKVHHLEKKGQLVKLDGVPFPVTISWFYLKRDGKLEQRFVLSTRPLKGSTISWWGKRRWSIEGFFKTSKHRFRLDRFGQQSLTGVYRWFVLCLISFMLAHWAYLSTGASEQTDWKAAAILAVDTCLADVVVCNLLVDIERIRPLLHSMGVDLQLIQLEI